MKIGFVFEGRWLGAKDGYYVKVRELYNSLRKHNDVIVTQCSLPGAKVGYKKTRDFFKFAKDLDAIVIIAGTTFTDKFTLSKFFSKRKVVVIWILESPAEEISILSWSKRSVLLNKMRMVLLSKFVDKCLCVSKEMEIYANKDLGIKNTLVLPNGSNPHLFKATNSRTVLDSIKDRYKVMWAGAGQYPWQGLDIITSVAKKMSSRKDIVFIVMTSQSWFSIPSDSRNLIVLNSVEYEHLPQYLNTSDLLLCIYKKNFRGSLYNSPMKLFDYMSMKKPIIASAMGQMKEIIVDGKNGLLTDNSIDDICSKILLLKKDPKLSSTLSSNARKSVINTYNWDNIAHQINNEISKIKKQSGQA